MSWRKNKLNNVKVNCSVARKELIAYYRHSHYLFLHLNDYRAFEKVIPSKLFEYGALNMPVCGRCQEYPARFIREQLKANFYSVCTLRCSLRSSTDSCLSLSSGDSYGFCWQSTSASTSLLHLRNQCVKLFRSAAMRDSDCQQFSMEYQKFFVADWSVAISVGHEVWSLCPEDTVTLIELESLGCQVMGLET